ncbi:MAG: hypothetical protein MJZ93_07090, partial [Paludibacteraceae bacterium]|nr:hypothetical protein [Paludibacteraceae bacterium]
YIDGNNIVWWQVNDQIAYFGKARADEKENWYTLSCNSTPDNGGAAYFTAKNAGGEDIHFGQEVHEAYYPASLHTTGDVLELPSNINVDPERNAKHLPMYAHSSGPHYLEFHNICAVLKIQIPTGLSDDCDKIEVSARKNICGKFTVGPSDYKAVLSAPNGIDNTKITLNGTFTRGNYVYVAIPEGTYSGFKVEFMKGTTSLGSKTNSNNMEVHANKIYPVTITPGAVVTDDMFHFTNTSSNSVKISMRQYVANGTPEYSIEYYKSGQFGWNTYSFSTTKTKGNEYPGEEITLAGGEKIYFRQTSAKPISTGGTNYYTYFYAEEDGTLSVSGDIRYLLNGSNPDNAVMGENAFLNLFFGNENITDASGLILPSTVSKSCYFSMFFYCSELTKGPSLPATTLAESCYYLMFSGCNKLETVTMLATDVSATNCLGSFVPNVNGTLTIANGLQNISGTAGATITSNIPAKWTIINNTGSWNGKDPASQPE